MRILVIGELCVDRYQYGTVDRLSPEAPVPVFSFDRTDSQLSNDSIDKDGMAGNVAENVRAIVGGVVGNRVNAIHNENVIERLRLIDRKSQQQILRLDSGDRDTKSILDTPPQTWFHKPIIDALLQGDNKTWEWDLILLCDYDKGFLDEEFIYRVISARKRKGPPIPRARNLFVKLNDREYERLHNKDRLMIDDENLIITLGEQGVLHKGVVYDDHLNFIEDLGRSFIDVCGAGDIFTAAFAANYATTGWCVESCIKFANLAAALSVTYRGGVHTLSQWDQNKIVEWMND